MLLGWYFMKTPRNFTNVQNNITWHKSRANVTGQIKLMILNLIQAHQKRWHEWHLFRCWWKNTVSARWEVFRSSRIALPCGLSSNLRLIYVNNVNIILFTFPHLEEKIQASLCHISIIHIYKSECVVYLFKESRMENVSRREFKEQNT